MKLRTSFLIAFSVFFFPRLSPAQCSDAGVCSIGKNHETKNHSVSFSYSFGRGGKADDLQFHAIHVDLGLTLLESSRVFATLPWTRPSGPLGSTSGIGDLTVVWDQRLLTDEKVTLAVQLGLKLATGAVNAGGLPQRYQTGLGSNDLLFGLSYTRDEWSAAVGYQVAGARNENSLDLLKRGDDLLLRLGYALTNEPLTASAELLAIKRMEKSSVRNPLASSGNPYYELPGSDQFQVNILGKVGLPLDDAYGLQLSVAIPLLKRDVNIDGLTRTLSLAAGLTYSF